MVGLHVTLTNSILIMLYKVLCSFLSETPLKMQKLQNLHLYIVTHTQKPICIYLLGIYMDIHTTMLKGINPELYDPTDMCRPTSVSGIIKFRITMLKIPTQNLLYISSLFSRYYIGSKFYFQNHSTICQMPYISLNEEHHPFILAGYIDMVTSTAGTVLKLQLMLTVAFCT